MEEQKKQNEPTKLQNQMTAIVVKTITRNSQDDSQEFLKKVGATQDLDENKVVMSMTLNALVEITKQLLKIEGTLNQATGFMRMLLTEEELIELQNKDEKGE